MDARPEHPSSPGKGKVGPAQPDRVGVGSVSRFNRSSVKTRIARRLRRDATDSERRLWNHLRSGQIGGHRLRRQHPAGPYVLDFYCRALRLAVELDGGQHAEPGQAAADRVRDVWLVRHRVTVLRFWNSAVLQHPEGVLDEIARTAEALRRNLTLPTRRWRADLLRNGEGSAAERK